MAMILARLILGICLSSSLLYGEMTPPKGKELEKTELPFHFSAWGQLLIWRQEPNDIYYGEAIPFSGSNLITLENIKPIWSPGFRVALGYNSDLDYWDISARWTRFYTSPSSSFQSNGPDYLIPLDTFSDTGSHMQRATSSFTTHFNLIEVQLGRHGPAGEKTSFRPFVGLRTEWLRVKYFNTYLDFNNLISTLSMKNNLFGVGVNIGIEGSWFFYKNFKISGNASSAFITGNLTTHQTLSSPTAVSYDRKRLYNYAVRSSNAFALGLTWFYVFPKTCKLSLSIDWEANCFSDFWGHIGVSAPSSRYLYFQGITLGSRLDF